MSGEAVPLRVVPAAVQGASSVIGDQVVPLAPPPSDAPKSMETAGMAAAAVDRAVDGYSAAFAQRLSTVADRLSGLSGAYTTREATNSQDVESVEIV